MQKQISELFARIDRMRKEYDEIRQENQRLKEQLQEYQEEEQVRAFWQGTKQSPTCEVWGQDADDVNTNQDDRAVILQDINKRSM